MRKASFLPTPSQCAPGLGQRLLSSLLITRIESDVKNQNYNKISTIVISEQTVMVSAMLVLLSCSHPSENLYLHDCSDFPGFCCAA